MEKKEKKGLLLDMKCTGDRLASNLDFLDKYSNTDDWQDTYIRAQVLQALAPIYRAIRNMEESLKEEGKE